MCFAQTAALRRGGRALSEKRKGHEGVDGDVSGASLATLSRFGRLWRGPDVALAWPWRGPGVLCGALVRCSFPAPTPPEPEREHAFFDAFEGIRVRLEGNACSGAGVGSKSGDPLTLWSSLARPWRGPDVALACYVRRWCGARCRPQPHPEPEREHGFSMPSK